MDYLMIIARVVHILTGIFWVGTLIVLSRFVFPAVNDAGADGAKVARGMAQRGLVRAIPSASGLTLLSGIYLYYRVSAGFQSEYMSSGPGISYGIGALSAIIAMILGGSVVRKAVIAGDFPKAISSGRLVAGLLSFTAFTMAIGRYV